MLSAVETPTLLEALNEINLPVVFANRTLRSIDADSVTLDNHKLGYMATNELISRGHKRIAHLAGSRSSNVTIERIRGYMDAMASAGLSVHESDIYFGDQKYEGGAAFGKQMLDDEMPFTAVFASNEDMVVGLLDMLEDHNIKCPDDISVICAMHTSSARVGKTKSTGLGYSSIKMGERAAELLLQRIKNPDGKKMNISFAPELTENNSIKTVSIDAYSALRG